MKYPSKEIAQQYSQKYILCLKMVLIKSFNSVLLVSILEYNLQFLISLDPVDL